jgi:mono/diheme cytochrome c family protein
MILSPELLERTDELNNAAAHLMSFKSGGAALRASWKHILKHEALDKWGLIIFSGQQNPNGILEVSDSGLRIGVAGCAMCHSGKAAGVEVVGLGNKTIDINQLATDLYLRATLWKELRWYPVSKDYHDIENYALNFLSRYSEGQYGNLTKGLVPLSRIRDWFYRVHGDDLPVDESRGQVKVPHWWGMSEKRKIGYYCDAWGDSSENRVASALSVELAAGQDPNVIKTLLPKAREAMDQMEALLPPPYPFHMDRAKAALGKVLFRANCQECHGGYRRDTDGNPIYDVPKRIAWSQIGSDFERLRGNTELFNQLAEVTPLRKEIRHTQFKEPGYLAPRLEGIWARFPYLHNASVPNIRSLLLPVAKRPKVWSMADAGERTRFSESDLGLTVPVVGSVEWETLENRANTGDRSIYNITRPGQSNTGHWFPSLAALKEDDIDDLIEYLKSL